MTKLTTRQSMALKAWAFTDPDFGVLSFDAVARLSGMPRHQVRQTVRAMARKGVTQYFRGCWTEDGDPAGSGYGLTDEGRVLLSIQVEAEDRAMLAKMQDTPQ